MAKWYVVRGDRERGPFDDAQLKNLAASGKLKSDHQIRRDGSTTTRVAKEIKGLFPSTRHEQIDQKQLPPALPDSKVTPTKPPSESASPQPQWTFSNLGKHLGTLSGIILLLIWGVRGYRQLSAVKPKQASTVTSENRGQAKKPILAKAAVTPPEERPSSANSIFEATGNRRGGFVDSNGKVVIEYSFDFPSEFSDGLAPMKSKGKWGYIDKTGQFVIKPQYDKANEFENGYAGVEVNDKYFCIDKAGKVCFESKFEVKGYSEGLFLLFTSLPPLPDGDQKILRPCHGYCDIDGKTVFTPRPCIMSTFTDGRAVVWSNDGRTQTSAIIDKNGQYVISPSPSRIGYEVFSRGRFSYRRFGFCEGLVAYVDDTSQLQGYLGLDGRIAISASKLQAQLASPFSEGLARIRRGANIGALVGGAPIPPDYTRYGYIDKRANNVIPCKYADGSNFSEGYAAVQSLENKKWGYVDKKGNAVIQFKYEKCHEFVEGRAAVQLEANGKWGYLDKNGNTVVEPKFDDADFFANGVARVKKEQLYGLIDTNGKFVAEPQFDHIGEFVDGIAWFERP